ncbi:hypothetical protein [uncultured Rikenella sp.]|uniref:hypothetical protein n=1 Tax=uncultured Rikenella sp. TaxID=368003 RepID=UPI0025E34BA0|nr:hypothetical protein [uncultured Rikenella sp.]
MKTFFLAIAAAAALVACSGKTGIEKELVGAYDAKLVLPDSLLDDAAVKMAAAIFSQSKIEMDFHPDGTVQTTQSLGENAETATGKWEVRNDSLFVRWSEERIQNCRLTKTEDGFILSNDGLDLVLTPRK